MDLALDSDLSVFIDHRNDLAVVEGRERFEQSVAIALTDQMQTVLSSFNRETIKEKLYHTVTRVARQHDIITTIDRIDVHPKKNAPDTFVVEVTYITSDPPWRDEVTL